MPIRLREWTQREWYNAGCSTFRASGDFFDLEGLVSAHRHEIRRAPAWEAALSLPTGFDSCEAMLYDHGNQRVVLIGQDSSDQLASVYADITADPWSWSSVTTLVASAVTIDGLDGFNAQWWGGHLWVIGSNGHVYRGSAYTASVTSFYAAGGGNAHALCPFGDRMHMVTTDGHFHRLADDGLSFESYLDTVEDMDVRGLFPFRGYLLVVGRQPSGNHAIHRLQPDANAPSLDTVALLPAVRGDEQLSGFVGQAGMTIHDDELYITPGRDKLLDGSSGCNLYAFNGSYVDFVCSYAFANASVVYYGLRSWRDHLMLYELGSGSQTFSLLVGKGWTTGIPTQPTIYYPAHFNAFCPGGELVMLSETAGGQEQILYLSHDALADATWESARYDMGSPSKQKRLEQITVLLDDALSNAKVVIRYRADDNGSWTTASTSSNTKRATAEAIAQTFYTLQVQVELDDDSGANKDYRIQAVSVLYSIDR